MFLQILSWLLFFLVHDTPVAKYTFTPNKECFVVLMEFDQKNLDFAVNLNYGYPVTENKIVKYVWEHQQYYCNNKPAELTLCNVLKNDKNYLIEAELNNNNEPIKSLKTENTCLIKEVEGHLNILYFNLPAGFRGFQLSESRTATVINF